MSRARSYARRGAPFQERLDHYTDKSAGPEGCWLWKGGRNNDYGAFYRGGRYYRAHRMAFKAANGSIPEGAHILHRCDTPLCVNPAHLFAGSHLDNMRDMYSKGRRRPPTGERNGRAKLTAETVQAIRAATGLQHEIGARFGVSQPTVSAIKLGYKWRHLLAADARAVGDRMDREALPQSEIREPL
jgi:Autographiviridae endonuclease